jgi:Transcription factor involved in chromatin remodeling, contains bromodomain
MADHACRDPYFLDFINLPPRSYKDYFAVIQNPLSLKGLQKLVKGIHGRQPATGISDFKTWAQFEEKASLLWENAHFYNEEGSVIHKLATELKASFNGWFYRILLS